VCALKREKEAELPPLYPSTMFLYPTVCLLSTKKYAFPVMGAIHVRNLFRFYKPLEAKKEYQVSQACEAGGGAWWSGLGGQGLGTPIITIRLFLSHRDLLPGPPACSLLFHQPLGATWACLPGVVWQGALHVEETPRIVKSGVEVSFPQVLLEDGKEIWNSTTTVLLRAKHSHFNPETSPKTSVTYLEAAAESQCVHTPHHTTHTQHARVPPSHHDTHTDAACL
jgi:hypothetical protein